MKNLFLIYLSCLTFILNGQNLISNPSFELHSSCPTSISQLENALDWTEPFFSNVFFDNCSTSDLYDICATNSIVVPNTATSGAFTPRTGNASAGIHTYAEFNPANGGATPGDRGYREYIQNELISPLVAGENYCISLWVRLSPNSQFYTSNFGIKFSQTIINIDCEPTPALPSLSLTSIGFPPDVIYSGGFISSTSTWVELTFDYTAVGGEEYFIFGDFSEKNASSYQSTGVPFDFLGGSAYYYIDDVSVIPGPCLTSNICNPSITSVSPFCQSFSNSILNVNLPGGTWSGAGIVDANTGEFSPSAAGVGVHNIVYIAPCGNSTNINITVLSDLECNNEEFPDVLINIPNTFTPNNDNNNDLFIITINEKIIDKNGDLTIFNRWGNKVYQSTDKMQWDGGNNNSGVYYYIFKYNENEYKGSITLFK